MGNQDAVDDDNNLGVKIPIKHVYMITILQKYILLMNYKVHIDTIK